MHPSEHHCYAIAVFSPLPTPLAYTGPPGLHPGTRVQAPLGSRSVCGIVLGRTEPPDGVRLRALSPTAGEGALLPESLLALGDWLTRYYHAPPGDVYELITPALARRNDPLPDTQTSSLLSLTERGAALNPEQLRGHRQQALLGRLQVQERVTRDELRAHDFSTSTVRRICDQGLATWVNEPVPADTVPDPHSGLVLTGEQQEALSHMRGDPDRPQLLLGATGSGKTELYIEWARDILRSGRQCLVLLPEIGLTPQMVHRFRTRLGMPVNQFHSGMTARARWQTWQAMATGTARIALGTRSAVLLPMAQPGLIVVDEEHDPSYKQWDGVRYHARDVAVWRARHEQCAIVLGSATPSLESLNNAIHERYALHRLARRSDQGEVARSLVDLRRHKVAHGVSDALAGRVDDHLSHGNQVMLFLNRRGTAPSMVCDQCGTVQQCPNCSAYLTFHQGPARLLCHHCAWHHPPPYPCESCAATQLTPVGIGTAGLEDYLHQRWPDTPVWRIDRDNVRSADDWQVMNEGIQSGKPGILVGTQMLAKGHDYPNVTLTGILDADSGLFSADFRAMERSAQLLTQVSGRAGRRRARAEVILQSRLPDHPLLNDFLSRDYEALARQLLSDREHALMPPFSHLATIRADHPDEATAFRFLHQVQTGVTLPEGVNGVGPMPALMSRRAGQFRMLWLLQSKARRPLHDGLDRIAQFIADKAAVPGRLTWGVDVDPLEF